MTLERPKGDERPARRGKRYAIALGGTAMAIALAMGSTPAAHADVVDDLASEFTTSAGGGQISNLVNQSLKLRSAGFRLTNGETAAIQDALKYRPNQTPLINALKDAVNGQSLRAKQAQAANQGQGPFTVGINQYDPSSPGGIGFGPGGINFGGGGYQIGGQTGSSVGPPG